MRTPFLDLAVQYKNIRDELIPAMESVMHRADFILVVLDNAGTAMTGF